METKKRRLLIAFAACAFAAMVLALISLSGAASASVGLAPPRPSGQLNKNDQLDQARWLGEGPHPTGPRKIVTPSGVSDMQDLTKVQAPLEGY